VKVHHLDLCTMCPYGGRLVSGGSASIFRQGEMVCHALVVESRDGLVLVDTGLGLDDVRDPMKRLGRSFVMMTRPRLREEHTALRQIERLGFARSDVRHIVVTHLDVDHAGGIPDFPDAQVHVHRAEHAAAMAPSTLNEKQRYRRVHFQANPKWGLHDVGGERWFGFDSVRAVGEDVLLVPLPGHTRGHCAVAVRAPSGSNAEWLLHCGDAYFFHEEMDEPPRCPAGLKVFQRTMAVDDAARRANAARLRELRRDAGGRVRLFSAHSPHELAALRGH
jgi:glyoxylase-like metal-dependent hydrolase (beta-lactamase superfamily II)